MPERPAIAPAAAPIPAVPVAVPEPEPEPEPEAIIDDDEDTIAAAPDASAFAPRAHVAKPVHTAIYANLFFRRTIIPIMLTCGVMLPAIGLWSMLDHNAPLAAIGTTVEIFLIVTGAVLLGLGILNAFHVKRILDTNAKRTAVR
jgi:NADH:ubiquinone oxidoreductase subunit K